MSSNRTRTVIMTNEARVLKRLRERSGLSMKAAGQKIGYSTSYISQIENGRENAPKGELLKKFLEAYDCGMQAYGRMVSGLMDELSDLEIINEILPRLKPEKLHILRTMAEVMLKGNK